MTSGRVVSGLRVGVVGTPITQRDGRWYTHHTFGRVVEELAARVADLRYSGPVAPAERTAVLDYPLDRENMHRRAMVSSPQFASGAQAAAPFAGRVLAARAGQ